VIKLTSSFVLPDDATSNGHQLCSEVVEVEGELAWQTF
jgi:hypothetical protein